MRKQTLELDFVRLRNSLCFYLQRVINQGQDVLNCLLFRYVSHKVEEGLCTLQQNMLEDLVKCTVFN